MTHVVRQFRTRSELDLAFHDGTLNENEYLYVIVEDSTWKLDISGGGFVEVPRQEVAESQYLIWWMNNWGLMATFSIMEQADAGNPAFSVLPGHLKMVLNQAERIQHYNGQLLAPVTMQATIDPELILDVTDENTLRSILVNGYFGIPFELVHFDTVKRYAGIITTPELKVPDRCALRNQLRNN